MREKEKVHDYTVQRAQRTRSEQALFTPSALAGMVSTTRVREHCGNVARSVQFDYLHTQLGQFGVDTHPSFLTSTSN